ncbi:uncharacterized protein LOC144139174 [Haemaphysalis longicornis]
MRFITLQTTAARALKDAQAAGGNTTWLISVGMRGRWSIPRYNQPLGMRSKCKRDLLAKSFGPYTEVCTDSDFSSKLQYDEVSRAMYTYEELRNLMFVYDDEKAICEKLCDIKDTYTLLRFGIAAYDLEYEDYENSCSRLNKFGAFSRLKMVRKIVEYFRTVTNDARDCVDYVPCPS